MSSRLIEVDVRVRDLERALHFYRDLVGLPFGDIETHEGDDTKHAHATWGDWDEGREFLMVNLYPAGDAGSTKASIGLVVDDLDAVHARLVAARAIVTRAPEQRPWGASATYQDADGNIITLTQRPSQKG